MAFPTSKWSWWVTVALVRPRRFPFHPIPRLRLTKHDNLLFRDSSIGREWFV